MKPPAGSLIAFATDTGQTAQDGDGSNGLYTEELLRHLRTPGLTIEQVFKRTRAAVLDRSSGQQIPAEYSRLVGDDIYLAGNGSAPAAPMPALVKAAPVAIRTLLDEARAFAKEGRNDECVDSLKLLAQAKGMGVTDAIADCFTLLLDRIKETLSQPTVSDTDAKASAQTCDLIIAALPDCLPRTHPQHDDLLAKAHNRRGDSLLQLGRADDALEAFNAAQPLAPDDAYILYNRARAHHALGDADNARADLRTASDPKFNQPKARELAQQMLAEMLTLERNR